MVSTDLVRGIRERQVPALARAISLVENGRDGYEAVLAAIHADLGRAYRVGLTGPPGAGKSTIIEHMVRGLRARGHTVAVVAVDPTSPYSGGALLGDRIRMDTHTLDPGVYIRSMATRGAVGGLATTTREVCDVLDAFGFDRILIETVGAGQSELAIAANADTAVLVLVPESGDSVQVLKAGVMEIADLYVVNKADREGADRLVQEVGVMLGFRKGQAFHPPASWGPPVLTTVASRGEGISELIDALERHREHLATTSELAARRRARLAQHTRDVVNRALSSLVWHDGNGEQVLAGRLDDVMAGRVSPYKVAADIVARLQGAVKHGG
jgi:LAO/AO transport system kinase